MFYQESYQKRLNSGNFCYGMDKFESKKISQNEGTILTGKCFLKVAHPERVELPTS